MQSKAKFNIAPIQVKEFAIKSLFYFLIIAIAYFSAYSTYNLAMTKFNNVIIAWLITIIIEGCLTAFSIKGKGYTVLWLCYLFVSIMASQGSIISDLDTKSYNNIHNSVEYKKYLSDVEVINNQITTYQNRINTINGTQSASDNSPAVNDLNSKIALKRNELRNTVKTTKTQRIRDDIQREIDSLERAKKELLNGNQQLNQTKTASINESNNIIAEISKLNDKKDNLKIQFNEDIIKFNVGESGFKKTLDYFGVTETGFWTSFFILLEISRFALILAVKKNIEITVFGKIKNTISGWVDNGKDVVVNTISSNDEKTKVGFQPSAHSPTSAVSARKIGFDYPILESMNNISNDIMSQESKPCVAHNFQEIDNVIPNVQENIKHISNNIMSQESKPCVTHNVYEIDNVILGYYLDYIFDNVKEDKSVPGYQTTTKELNKKHKLSLGIDSVRKIKNHCEQLNILKSDSDSRKTYILKQKNEIKV